MNADKKNDLRVRFLWFIAAIFSLALVFFAAFEGTNDCDLGDIVLMLALPGFLLMVVASFLVSGKIRFSLFHSVGFADAIIEGNGHSEKL